MVYFPVLEMGENASIWGIIEKTGRTGTQHLRPLVCESIMEGEGSAGQGLGSTSTGVHEEEPLVSTHGFRIHAS
jgi:hypothetical protein